MQILQMKFMHRWAPELLSLLRVMAAGSFFTHGTMKLFSWPAPFEFPMNAMLYVAGVLEVIGGLLLIMGLFSRPVAVVGADGFRLLHRSRPGRILPRAQPW